MKHFVDDKQLYTVTLIADTSVTFTVTASSELVARQEALDKIGYGIEYTKDGYCLVDADDPSECEAVIPDCSTLAEAFTKAFPLIGWRFSEPTHMVGGALGDGFDEMTEDN